MTTEEYLLKRISELEEENKMWKKMDANRFYNDGYYQDVIKAKDKQIENKDSEILRLNKDCDAYRATIKSRQEFLNSITPTQVLHNEERGNTTVKFFDGSSITVKKMKGDKDCLETAIVWAIFKKMHPSGLMRNLVKHTIETGGK